MLLIYLTFIFLLSYRTTKLDILTWLFIFQTFEFKFLPDILSESKLGKSILNSNSLLSPTLNVMFFS